MTSTKEGDAGGAPRPNWTNRIVLLAFAAAAVVFIILPQAVIWWGARHACPSLVVKRGVSNSTAWEIIRNDCGGEIGDIWQLRVIPDKGYSTVVMESRGGPQPAGWEQSGFTGTVILAAPAAGTTETKFLIKLDPKGQPTGMIQFKDGKPLP